MRSSVYRIAVLAAILLEGIGISAMSQGSRSRPIEKAILNGDLNEVRRLIEGGGDLNERMFLRETPAIMAASADAWDIVLYLLETGADPSLADDAGLTISRFATNSLVAPDTKEGRALEQVRQILRSRGLL